ncbi:hypothetical protein D7217_13340 [Legionella pneumophila]|nr:hypothetical protein D7217_13340 [Legionella pneumophila]HAT9856642.1 hypothetical protein [Legionella pneumophila subsp. pneumophila]HAT6901825.1 hypothetical protein [Legionella pneumophila]HAT8674635.1 hypothetical protein [Legionella pneumophila]HAU1022476.1 hypothetical protein [Legionella pneumophila]
MNHMAICINKETDHFFISIGKINQHSFIMLGVYDDFQVSHLLCRVGKIFDLPNQTKGIKRCLSIYSALGGAIFASSKAKIEDEGITRKRKGSAPISYQAYDISYEQYCEFVHYLESIQTESNQFECFKPLVQNGNAVYFSQTSSRVFATGSHWKELNEEIHEINTGNTCRHSAIKLIEAVTKTSVPSSISSCFFINLPYKTQLDYGKPSQNIPFYVLPPPPPSIHPGFNKEKRLIAKKLYHRIEQLPVLEPNSPMTKRKFNSLKNLYLQIIGSQKNQSIDELLFGIQQWKEKNRVDLQTLRRTYFWDSFIVRESATMKLINEIEKDLKCAKCPY